MKSEFPEFPAKRIWWTAIITALLVGTPLAFFIEREPWLIAVPIGIGTFLIMVHELFQLYPVLNRKAAALGYVEPELPFVQLPKGFLGLSGYRKHVALGVPTRKDDPDQEIFEFLQTPRREKSSRQAKLIKDESGQEFYLIDAERFVTLLVNRMIEGADKVAELSMSHAASRYKNVAVRESDLERFLKDKGVLEVIKSDYRGNLVQMLNRSGEEVVRELVKQARDLRKSRATRAG